MGKRYKYAEPGYEDFNSDSYILNFIFHLNLLVPGITYDVKNSFDQLKMYGITSSLSNQIQIDLDCVGLVKVKNDKYGEPIYFSVTPLIHNILISQGNFEQEFTHSIIVEKDFKIYAFTKKTNFMESFLRLFSRIKFKFPGMLVATQDELKQNEAFKNGIKVDHILRYLNKNAHPNVVASTLAKLDNQQKRTINETWAYIPINVVQGLKNMSLKAPL